MINYNNLIYEEKFNYINSLVANEIIREEKDGITNISYFLAFSCMLRELLPFYSYEEIYTKWIEYRIQIIFEDLYRDDDPKDLKAEDIKGFEKIESVIDKGGVIFSFHYGNYRAMYKTVYKRFVSSHPEKKIIIIVDRDSYAVEPERNLNDDYVEYLVTDDLFIGVKIYEHLEKGNWIFLFIDGNTGVGKDRKAIELQFISSLIRIRSGFFRILSKTDKPVFPMIAGGDFRDNELLIHDNVNIFGTPEKLAEECYKIMNEKMTKKPQYWRMWFNHYKQVKQWYNLEEEGDVDFFEIKFFGNDSAMAINKNNGKIYKLEK